MKHNYNLKKILGIVVFFVALSSAFAQSPGGVSASAWYKADAQTTVFSDAGTTNATDNSTVHQWNEYLGTGHNLIQNTTGARPTYSNATTLVNFNPTVSFNLSYLEYQPGTGIDIIDRTEGTLYTAGYFNTVGPAGIFGFDASMDYPGLHTSNNGLNNLLFYTGGPGYQGLSSSQFSDDAYFVAGANWVNGAGASAAYASSIVSLDGVRSSYNDTELQNAVINNLSRDIRLGRDSNWGALNGQLNEVIIFDTALTLDEMDRVESYLSIKYGNTYALGASDYKNSSSATVWSATNNATYNQNIFGIARDNNSDLYQKQSKSTNQDQQLIIGAGNSLFDTNAANTNTLTEGQFLIVGDNGLEQNLKIPLVYTAGTNGETNFRFEAIWKAENTNGVGIVTVAWPTSIGSMYLVRSTDETFDNTDDFTPMDDVVTVNGVDYNTATVTLADGAYFTLAGFAYAPGGVVGPDFWVKSDDAGDIATAWKDHSVNADDIPSVGGMTLSAADRAHNFHPYTTGYTGSNYFYNDVSVLNPTNGLLSDVSHSIFSAVRPTSAGTGRITGIDDTPGYASEPAFSIENGELRFYKFSGGANADQFTEEPFRIGAINVVSGIGNNPAAAGGTSTSAGGERVLGMNGVYKTYPNTDAGNRFHFNGQHLRIGDGAWSAPGAFPGDIMEVVWYKRPLTANEQSRVNSYLAIKNGVTLSENYLSANSNIVWDITINAGYNNNIFGMARDNVSALHQKQAASTNTGQKLVIGNGSSLFDTNADNTNTLTEGQFLMVGDNGLTQALSEPLVYTAGGNGDTNFRFETIWKAQNTNGVGQVTVALPVGVNNLYVVQSTDETFTDTDTFTAMTGTVTVNGEDYNTATVTLNDGEYFTFAGYMLAPGGVAGQDFWVRSDMAGDITTAWKDHSANADDIPAVGTWTLSPADRAHNFHPYTTDYTNSKYFNNLTSVLNPTNGQLDNVSHSIFSAVRPTSAGTGRIIGIDDDGNGAEPGFSIEDGNLRLYKFSGGANADQFDEEPFKIGAANIVSGIGNNPTIVGGTSTSAGGERVLGVNGVYKTYPNTTSSNRFHIQGQRLRIGDGAWTAPGPFPGDIMEVVWYKRPLTANEQSRVNSYLAIKNGATLSENYLAANSSTVWDITINAGYNNNIFGMARDNVSALHQKQATSTNTGQKLVIGNGSSLFDTNADNTNTLTEGQFLIVGDNGLAQSLTTPLSYTAGSNGDTNFRFESIWKVQNTNGVGTVTVAWPVGIENLYVVQSTDETFDGSDNFTEMTSTVTINGVDYNTATVNLADGEYFTFAGYGYAPAGVVNSLSYWYRADKNATNTGAGTDVTDWTDFFSGTVVSQMGTNDLPVYVEGAVDYFNFNPGVNFTAGTQTLGNNTVRTLTSLDYDVFTFTKEDMANGGANPRYFSIAQDNSGAVNNAIMDAYGLMPNGLGVERRPIGGGTQFPSISPGFATDIPSIMYLTNTNTTTTKGLNGDALGSSQTYNAQGEQFGGHFYGDTQFAGNGSDNRGFVGHIGETIVYGSGSLTPEERRRVDSYLAIKYGITLGRVDTEHYLGSTASATSIIWNGADNTAYNNNIFGMARSDIGGFEQKVSKSVNTGTILTLATIDDYVLDNLDASRTSFINDEAYLLFGDNEATGETSLATDPCTGETLNPAVSSTNKVWRVENTNTTDAVWLQADLSTYTFNSDIKMWVADNENFTTNLVRLPAASYEAGIATFNVLFPEGVKYIKFAGVVAPSQCDVCTGGTFVFKTGRSWDTTTERTNNVIDSETIGTTDQGDLIVDMDVADPNNVEYGPTSTPRPYGRWMISRRYDNNETAVLTHTINLNQAVAGASFQISNINTYLNNANRFTIEGYDCDGNLVMPKITDAIAASAATTYEIQGNEVVGTKPYRGLASLYSTANVRFDRVIQSIVIVAEVDRTNTRNTLRSLNVGDISFECAAPLPPTEDNVTMVQDFTQSEDVPTCLETTMRMRFVNSNCDTRTIDVSQTLPAGLEFVEDTYNDSEFATTPAYTYNANTFTLNGLELPSGTNYLYINVRSTDGTTSTYNTSSSFTVQETGNSYNSIDPAGNADSQVSFEASGYTEPALDVSYTVDATCLEEGTPVTYTLNFDNQEASAIAGATLKVYYALGQEITSVILNNGITGDHGFGPVGESYIEMTNVNIPTGQSSIDVLMDITSDIFTDEPTASSVFQLISEPGNACAEESPLLSNVIELESCEFCTQPGATGTPTEFAKVGISDREGSVAAWPGNVPNGFIAMQSENSGFVITRVQQVNDIANPVEGMLVYEIQDQCIKLYNGTDWNCIERSCNE